MDPRLFSPATNEEKHCISHTSPNGDEISPEPNRRKKKQSLSNLTNMKPSFSREILISKTAVPRFWRFILTCSFPPLKPGQSAALHGDRPSVYETVPVYSTITLQLLNVLLRIKRAELSKKENGEKKTSRKITNTPLPQREGPCSSVPFPSHHESRAQPASATPPPPPNCASSSSRNRSPSSDTFPPEPGLLAGSCVVSARGPPLASLVAVALRPASVPAVSNKLCFPMPRDLGPDLRLRAFLGFLGLFRRRISRLLIRWKQGGSREGMDYVTPLISFHADIVRLLPPQPEPAKLLGGVTRCFSRSFSTVCYSQTLLSQLRCRSSTCTETVVGVWVM
jgi:hypothetical protein